MIKSTRRSICRLLAAIVFASVAPNVSRAADELDLSPPDPTTNPGSGLMLKLEKSGADPTAIDHSRLLHIPAQPATVSDVRIAGGERVHQHAYLAHFDGKYWAMWSDGPGKAHASPERHWNVVPGHDRADTRVSFATSPDGLNWSEVQDLSGPPKSEGYGYIARGFWEREGELLALASHFKAPGYASKGLSLVGWKWNSKTNHWDELGLIYDDALNNFPPKRLPGGEWMMTRRNHRREVSVLIGGTRSVRDWVVQPLAIYDGGKRQPEEPYWYILPDDETLVGLFRDNSGSKRLLRAFSSDDGQSWSSLVATNFPDATSKFYALRTSRGYYALVSNSNPRRRDPLTLSISRDGLVYTHLFYLVGGRHIDYPHMIEHDDHLLISFSGAKQTVEVVKVPLAAIDALID